MSFKKIPAESIRENAFTLISSNLLLAAGDCGGANAMTVSWGGLGVLWGKNIAMCFVRPQRYTYEFMEKGRYFTLSSYPPGLAGIHAVFGAKSGRDIDKPAATGLTYAFADCGAAYFQQAELVIVCEKIYSADFDPKRFTAPYITACYPEKDYHRMYIGEILEVLQKD